MALDMRKAVEGNDKRVAEEGAAKKPMRKEAWEEGERGIVEETLKARERSERESQEFQRKMRELERLARRLENMLSYFETMRSEIRNEIAVRAEDEIGKAIGEVSEAALAGIKESAEAARSQIEALDRESRERTMRLLKITLPERIFKRMKWGAVIVVILAGASILIQQWF